MTNTFDSGTENTSNIQIDEVPLSLSFSLSPNTRIIGPESIQVIGTQQAVSSHVTVSEKSTEEATMNRDRISKTPPASNCGNDVGSVNIEDNHSNIVPDACPANVEEGDGIRTVSEEESI